MNKFLINQGVWIYLFIYLLLKMLMVSQSNQIIILYRELLVKAVWKQRSSHIMTHNTLKKSVDFKVEHFSRRFRDPSRPNTWLAYKCVIIHICVNNEIKASCSAVGEKLLPSAKSVTSHARVFDMDHREVIQRVIARRVATASCCAHPTQLACSSLQAPSLVKKSEVANCCGNKPQTRVFSKPQSTSWSKHSFVSQLHSDSLHFNSKLCYSVRHGASSFAPMGYDMH